MGAADRVVGVEDYETKATMDRLYNYVYHDRFKDLPVIGTNGQPYTEQIIAAGPDVIVMSKYASVDADDLQRKTGIPVVVVPGSDDVLDQDTFETIAVLGRLLGAETRAQELTSYLRDLETDLAARSDGAVSPKVYVGGVAYKGYHGIEGTEAGYGPLALIGADNLADTVGKDGAFDIDPEQILAWDPEVIFLNLNGLALINEHHAKDPAFYEDLTAVREGRVYAQISFRSCAVNLDTALAGAYYAGHVLYPERFADVDPAKKAGEIFQMLLGRNCYDELKEAGYELRRIEIGT